MSKIREDIKEQLLSIFQDQGLLSNDYPSYFNTIESNLIDGMMGESHKAMFEKGSGGELSDTPAKAKAIDSSSMLSYNFLKKIGKESPVIIQGIDYDKVFFEVRLKTLPNSNAPANMDVVLLSVDNKTALFIESKFLEYLDTDNRYLSSSYFKKESYYDDNEENTTLFEISTYDYDIQGKYKYGIKQNICHLIGVSNLNQSEKAKTWFYNNNVDYSKEILKATTYKFINLIFEPDEERAHKLYDVYKNDLNHLYCIIQSKKLDKYINNDFIMTYKELFDLLKYPDDYKDKLKKKYLRLHR